MKKAVILGGGESGYGSAMLALTRGFEVFLSDSGAISSAFNEKLTNARIPFEESGHTETIIFSADLVIKSPGIPDDLPLIRELKNRNIPVISEIEFAGRYLAPHTRTICITGSNGKTTTTTLIYEIMRLSGAKVELAGNIGRSLALQIAEKPATEQPDWYVVELSSFQLDGMFDFRADIALLLNITPDHLDRYDYDLEKYAASKFRIARNQRPQDCFIYSADDPVTARLMPFYSPSILSRRISFGLGSVGSEAHYDPKTDTLAYRNFSFRGNDLKIRGPHNKMNALAAAVACLNAGVDAEKIASGLKDFKGIEHRMELVGEVDGVLYINDSKATNVDAVQFALQAVDRPLVWIAGGTDKGNDYSILEPLVRKHVKALVCMGVDNSKLIRAFEGVVPIYDTHSLGEAIEACRKTAQPGDVVLLSPACASFDLFRNYEDRGEQFKKAVLELEWNQ